MKTSCRDLDAPLLAFSGEPFHLAVDPLKLALEGGFDARRPPVPSCYFANVVRSDAEMAGDSAVDSASDLVPVDRRIHIIRRGRDLTRHKFTLKGKNYDSHNELSIKIMTKVGESLPEEIPARLRALRRGLGMNQAKFAKLLSTQRFSVSQSLISLWESGERIPPAVALARLSELAEEKDRQWWRDHAAMQAGIPTQSEGNVIPPLGRSISSGRDRTIPVINPKRVGDLGTVSAEHVEEQLRLPADWFPMGGEIRAVRMHDNPISPVIEGDYLAILDISRRDPDRLTDCVVATRTMEGITARRLRKQGQVYFLQSLNDVTAPPRLLKHDGEDSIVGQVLKWIGDAPAASPSVSHKIRKTKRAR